MNYTGKFSDIKHIHDQSSVIIDQIERHTEKVRKYQVKCPVAECKHCKEIPDHFKRHEARKRQFYVVVEQFVKVVIGLLVRWKCSSCGKTFTDYPEFALPYKRYTLPMITAYSHHYVNNDEINYRRLVNKIPIGYPNSDKKNMDHSTVHRWISTLGGYSGIVRRAHDLIIRKDPDSTICHESANLSVHRSKYRSNQRKQLLIQCLRLLKLENLYQSVFGVSIFPNLATTCGFS